MDVAYVLLYLIAPNTGMIAVPKEFATMDECKATADGVQMGQVKQWTNGSGPIAFCVPVMEKS